MPTDQTIQFPTFLLGTFQFVPPTVYFFTDPIRGRFPRTQTNYTQIDAPTNLPTYTVENIQDWYRTNDSPEYLLPLFLNFPATTFSEFDSFEEITTVTKDAIDLLSYRAYGTEDYWWVIFLSNNILDPFTITPGTILRLPSTLVLFSQWLAPGTSQIGK